jgi:hypothetical protein
LQIDLATLLPLPPATDTPLFPGKVGLVPGPETGAKVGVEKFAGSQNCVGVPVDDVYDWFGVSRSCINRIRNGSRGWPLQNGLGARPWELHEREQVEHWHARWQALGEAKRRRALERIDRDEPVSLEVEPTDEEALSLVPGKPGSLVLFKNRLTLKPYVPPPAPTAPVPAKGTAGVFYDRR